MFCNVIFNHDQNWIHVHVHILFINNNASCFFCLCELCVHDSFYKLCIRKQSLILFFYSFSWDKSWRMIFINFFYQNWCIFLYHCVQFSCSLFIFFSFNQKFKSHFLSLLFHVINQVNKIQVFFTFNNHKQWFRYLSFYQIMLWE